MREQGYWMSLQEKKVFLTYKVATCTKAGVHKLFGGKPLKLIRVFGKIIRNFIIMSLAPIFKCF